MISSDLLALLVRVQLVASAAMLALLALRRLVRLDPDARVWLWTVPVVAAIGDLLPKEDLGAPASAPMALEPWAGVPFAVWLGGALMALARLACLHAAFLRDAKRGRAGPAVVGVVRPKIVMPSAPLFTPEERAMIRAHEWEHIHRNDLAVRRLLAVLQCLFWFNPLVHVAAAELRLDQELACDESVVRLRGRRRLYVEALLKAQAGQPSPLGCHWLARGPHPLETRVAALVRPPAGEGRRAAAMALGLALGLAAVAGAWATAPAHRPAWLVEQDARSNAA